MIYVRVNFDVPKPLKEEINQLLGWGVQAKVFRCMLEQLVADVKKRGRDKVLKEILRKDNGSPKL